MSVLREQIDIAAPATATWDQLHRFNDYPKFVAGMLHARTESADQARINVTAGGTERAIEAHIVDGDRLMTWETDSSGLRGEFAVRPLDDDHTRVQVRLEYDPDSVRETFGGPRGFAQSDAVAQAVQRDLERFKSLVES